jgi:hypothetical protein
LGVAPTDTSNALTSVPCVIKANSGNLKLGTSRDESLHCERTDILHATATTVLDVMLHTERPGRGFPLVMQL